MSRLIIKWVLRYPPSLSLRSRSVATPLPAPGPVPATLPYFPETALFAPQVPSLGWQVGLVLSSFVVLHIPIYPLTLCLLILVGSQHFLTLAWLVLSNTAWTGEYVSFTLEESTSSDPGPLSSHQCCFRFLLYAQTALPEFLGTCVKMSLKCISSDTLKITRSIM